MKNAFIAACMGATAMSGFYSFAAEAQADMSAPQANQSGETDADAGTSQLQEIVVTANRRAERLQDVPIAVNALSAELVERSGVTGTTSLVSVVPSLVVVQQGNAVAPYIRGIGYGAGDANAENSVAIYIDGVYQPIGQSNFFEFNNIERIEVLKGPQGTLFGRNATGGVIQIITRNPSFDPKAEFNVGYANYDTVDAKAYLSAGLTDKIAADVSFMYSNRGDGWGRNLFKGGDVFKNREYSVRSKIMYQLSEDTQVILAGDYYHFNNEGAGNQPAFGLSGDPRNYTPPPGGTTHTPVPVYSFPGNPALFPGLPNGLPYPGRYNQYTELGNSAKGRNEGVSLRIEHDFGAAQIRSITAYRHFSALWSLDADQSQYNVVSVPIDQYANTFTQELHLLAPQDAKFQWLAGAFYYRQVSANDPETISSDFIFPSPFTSVRIDSRAKSSSVAIFAQGTYPITETTNLTLGARYTWEKVNFRGKQDAFSPGSPVAVPFIPENTGKLSYSKPTWRITLDQKLAPDVLAYASYNRGIKSGNFSLSVPSAVGALYLPERLDAFEVGLKSQLLDRRLRINLAGFYYDYANKQFQYILLGASQTVVAKSTKIYGGELELEVRPTRNLTINGNIGYLHSRIGDFPNAPATFRAANGISFFILNYNAKGNRVPSAPEFSGNIGFNYEIPATIGTFNISSNLYYTGKYFTEVDNRLFVKKHPLLSASLRWADRSDRISVSLWGKNLTNEYFYAQHIGIDQGTDLGVPAAPRTYGVTLGVKM